MNDGVHTPEQAARSLRVVRLVSFGGSVLLFGVLLLAIVSLRYRPLWPPQEAPRIAVVSEVLRIPLPQPEARPHPRRTPEPEAEPHTPPIQTPSAEPPSEPVVITAPIWIERPRNPERFYPREAFMGSVAGEAVLDCDVDTNGRMTCVVAAETPPGRGFGEAALRIANEHVMRPAMQNGTVVRGRYRMIVPFSPGA